MKKLTYSKPCLLFINGRVEVKNNCSNGSSAVATPTATAKQCYAGLSVSDSNQCDAFGNADSHLEIVCNSGSSAGDLNDNFQAVTCSSGVGVGISGDACVKNGNSAKSDTLCNTGTVATYS